MYTRGSLFGIVLSFTVLFATVPKVSCTAETIFIKTNSSDYQCPAEPCLTLTEFMSYYHVESNTVVKFLPGKHILLFAINKSIAILDVVNITLTSVGEHQSSVIHCVSEFSIIAINVQNLTISKLSFSGCGAPIPEEELSGVDSSVPTSATLYLVHISNGKLLDTHVYDSKGAGMLVLNGFDLILSRTSFTGNIPNCAFMFMNESSFPVKLHTFIYITDSNFTYGISGSSFYGGGLSLIFLQTSHTVHVNIVKVALYNNFGIYNGNFFMMIDEWSCKYTMVQAEKIRSSNGLRRNRQGFFVKVLPPFDPVSPHLGKLSLQFYTLHVMDSYFDGATAVYVVSVYQQSKNLRVKFTNVSIFTKIKKSIAIHVSDVLSMELKSVKISDNRNIGASILATNCKMTLRDVSILGNNGTFHMLVVWKSEVTFLGNTTIAGNRAEIGTFYVRSSTLIFQGNAEFVNNTGYNGGALALYEGSEIVIGRHAHLKFIGNHAKHFGGALYVDNPVFTYYSTITCFYKLAETFNSSMKHRIVFENNTADYAGSAFYGGWVDFCETDTPDGPMDLDFDILSQLNKKQLDLSLVASNPLRVCMCNNSRPECSITRYNTMAYPGTTIQIPAVAVGQRFGTVPSTVHSKFRYELLDGTYPKIKDWQYTQRVEKQCTNLIYTIMSPPQVTLTMVMQVENIETPSRYVMFAAAQQAGLKKLIHPAIYFVDLKINIETLFCPLGFEFHNKSMMCTCDSKLVEYGINCSIDAQTIWRKNLFWITTAVESGRVLIHEHCPFDYCKPGSFDLDLEDPDEQCAFHRTGILCGACQNNLSHVFGTSACRECSSLWALLLVPVIALAGIALVVLLIVLNLTVSVGTINGLIFYANIVRANHATFFPPNTTNSFLSWFIAWINLDLGIETCFYNGLDAYVKTWLQFVFPFYIWFLVVTIIVLSHYFTLAARLSGRNAVPVLATLFLLSYAKLLRIIITVLQSTVLNYPDSSVRKVWLYDGNIDYLNGKHIPLFIAALFLLLISFPYTALLIFIQYLQHWSSYRVLFWVKKLKPLFDAYTGPYKDKHRYWTGLLLLLRTVLFLTFSMNTRGSSDINLLATSLTVLLLLVYVALAGTVYKTWALNAIEYSYFLNLGVFASATFYTALTGQSQTRVAYTSVSIAFVLFIIIVVFHLLTKFKSSQHYNWISTNIIRKMKVKLSKLRSAVRNLCCKQRRPHHHAQPRVTQVTVELRESLLEYCTE